MDFFKPKQGQNMSYSWQSIHKASWVLKKGCRWNVGNGEGLAYGRTIGYTLTLVATYGVKNQKTHPIRMWVTLLTIRAEDGNKML
jgi:hypothetical protein